jgi:acyl-CoA thioesterase FadM
VKVECQYLSPLRFNAAVEVRLLVKRIGEKSVTYVFQFRTAGRLTAHGEVTIVSVGVDPAAAGGLVSRPLPDELRKHLQTAPESAYAGVES